MNNTHLCQKLKYKGYYYDFSKCIKSDTCQKSSMINTTATLSSDFMIFIKKNIIYKLVLIIHCTCKLGHMLRFKILIVVVPLLKLVYIYARMKKSIV